MESPNPDSPNLAVQVEGVSVQFEVFSDRRAGLKSRLLKPGSNTKSVVAALKNVTFEIFEGETVALIGLNGSGKSTLMAAIAGVLPVSEGEILVSDEPRLMGAGSVLLPESSGRRNIRLGCLALGMSARQVDANLEQLIAFTELGEAIDRPLKTYSTGMRARIQFVIATSLQPRILLVDEALSVGDKDFRKKSADRLKEVIASAGTLVMVNHSLEELKTFCERAIWLREGEIVADGPIGSVIEEYLES